MSSYFYFLPILSISRNPWKAIFQHFNEYLYYWHLVYLILKVLEYEIRICPKSHNKVTMTVYVSFEFLWNRLYLLIITSNFRILIRNKFWRIWYRAVVKSYQELLFMAVLLWIKRKRLNLKNLHKIILKKIRLRRILFHAAWTFQEHHLMLKTWLNRWKMQVNQFFLDFFKTAAPEIYICNTVAYLARVPWVQWHP